MTVPSEILDLVERFDRNAAAYRAGQYNETQVRREFIDPFFEALGWDVNNRQGYAEAYKDVIHEDAIKIGGATKAPDYCFRVGGNRKFFVEAKKPAVNIKEDVAPAFQLRRYAWSAKLPLSILTDFEEFAVYDCRVEPAKTDKASTARTLYMTYIQLAERWEEIHSVFSREAVLKGSFDKYAESARLKKGTAEVDNAFLKEIESWRESLARNLAVRNPELTQRELNHAVQLTIDRIIFLRICEDRGIEPYGQLQRLLGESQVYEHLTGIFRRADERYNSGLFHFENERGRPEAPDTLTLDLAVDDRVLKDVFKRLYYPDSPYEFSVLPADILGHVYEQFLGQVIRLTPGHRAVVEPKPEVKKAGGVYYTPTYVVEFVVGETLGKLLKDKKPRQASRLRVIDPSCGSGSFLIGAYQYLLDWHRDWYVADGPEKHRGELYQGPAGDWRLTTAERKRILLNNIYGVDIDAQAVEVTKLSLLLKVLEGESEQTLNAQLRIFHERALPDLGDNIKSGNSLIGPDFYDGEQLGFLDEEAQYRINVFDWEAEFPEVMGAGGFDAVVGNPPWGADFTDPELAYLRRRYGRVVARMIDSYIYFIDKATQIAKPGAPIGFIIPSTLLNQVDARPARELLLGRGLSVLVSLGQGIFGSKVLNTSTIFVSEARKDSDPFKLANLSALPLPERKYALGEAGETPWRDWRRLVEGDPHRTYFVDDVAASSLLDRLRKSHPPLEDILEGTIQRGVSPDVAPAHVVSPAEARAERLEAQLLRPSVSGSQIKRYREWEADQFIIYTTRSTQIRDFPRVLAHLERFRHLNTCREVVEKKHPWWALHRPRDPQIFESPKIIGLTTSKTIELIYDPEDSVCVTDAMYVFSLRPGHDPWACIAVLQSKLFLFLYRVSNQGESRVIPQVKASKLQTLPYPDAGPDDPLLLKLSQRASEMVALHRQAAAAKLPHEVTRLQRQIAATDRQINRLVYELYGLTDAEIELVEKAIP